MNTTLTNILSLLTFNITNTNYKGSSLDTVVHMCHKNDFSGSSTSFKLYQDDFGENEMTNHTCTCNAKWKNSITFNIHRLAHISERNAYLNVTFGEVNENLLKWDPMGNNCIMSKKHCRYPRDHVNMKSLNIQYNSMGKTSQFILEIKSNKDTKINLTCSNSPLLAHVNNNNNNINNINDDLGQLERTTTNASNINLTVVIVSVSVSFIIALTILLIIILLKKNKARQRDSVVKRHSKIDQPEVPKDVAKDKLSVPPLPDDMYEQVSQKDEIQEDEYEFWEIDEHVTKPSTNDLIPSKIQTIKQEHENSVANGDVVIQKKIELLSTEADYDSVKDLPLVPIKMDAEETTNSLRTPKTPTDIEDKKYPTGNVPAAHEKKIRVSEADASSPTKKELPGLYFQVEVEKVTTLPDDEDMYDHMGESDENLQTAIDNKDLDPKQPNEQTVEVTIGNVDNCSLAPSNIKSEHNSPRLNKSEQNIQEKQNLEDTYDYVENDENITCAPPNDKLEINANNEEFSLNGENEITSPIIRVLVSSTKESDLENKNNPTAEIKSNEEDDDTYDHLP